MSVCQPAPDRAISSLTNRLGDGPGGAASITAAPPTMKICPDVYLPRNFPFHIESAGLLRNSGWLGLGWSEARPSGICLGR